MALPLRGGRVRLNWFRLVGVVVALAAAVALLARLTRPNVEAPTGAPDEGALRQSLGTSPHPR